VPPCYIQGGAIHNRVAHTDRPGLVLVSHADPNFARDKRHEIEYEFSGRGFYADRSSAARMRIIEAP
jgi:hypothetical protein